ncbi:MULTISPECIES: thiol-disulfide oxidoreductase DCC family protein [unclassified Myroides]|uniref:thiol-disulfide oxidoreductase DCC family protein n=1 Tax=unclassified Myroides TaxID=2642485 RepID=UPI0015F9B519|nr:MULTISPECIES: thiol-disulfide oxidoreductase DCC family protein [unclassified Myroides]MBB1149910.1 thiol-disulfide oxidoreductase DCC family protein [Myroides sp. NP-2]MDM1408280.1 thiol-disulfide oxidoreductase DCC family protein [Myroides sp. DF42-4-2]
MIEQLPKDKKIVLFDGVCNLCDNVVKRVIEADHRDQFRFTSLDSELGQQILQQIGVDRSQTDSIVLYQPGEAYYIKSQAALMIAKYLGGWYYLLTAFLVLPTKLADSLYDFIAKNRYKWYGKKDQCMIPDESIRKKFL